MNDNIIIRPAEQNDFETIYMFLCELEEITFDKSALKLLYFNNISNDNYIYLVATKKGDVVGYVSCHGQDLLHHGGRTGEIHELFVAKANRNTGIGKQLLQEVLKKARKHGILQLEITSNNNRTAAHEFYLREGFTFTHKKFVFPL